jgi:DNA-binding HxlR family transcriptional regulator
MQRLPEMGFPCPVARVADLIGDPWTPLLLRDAMFGARRFEDFHRYLGIGHLSPHSLGKMLWQF